MKITKPAEVVSVCDLCHRADTYLQVCWTCGKEFCLSCRGQVAASYGFLTICHDCQDRPDVHAVCERYAKRLMPIFQERDAKLKKLRKKKPAAVDSPAET